MVFDLHCDLLAYLAMRPYHSAFDAEARCSIPQLMQGDVAVQTMAIFTETKRYSEIRGMRQWTKYKNLHIRYAGDFAPFQSKIPGKVRTVLAIENASSIVGERESLDEGIARLQRMKQQGHTPLYLSLTWNGENRFGGGNTTDIGLKSDGKEFLLRAQGLFYAVDLSHTSDALAYDCIEFIDAKKLPYKIMASHSNFRDVRCERRNLVKNVADEIVRRQGIIGLNFIARFTGDSFQQFYDHIEYGLQNGYENAIALGADFFSDKILTTPASHSSFFPEYDTSCCYERVIPEVVQRFGQSVAQKIARENVTRFLQKYPGS